MIGHFTQRLHQGVAPNHPMTNKGGGGSGQRAATKEERRLWAAQANSLEQMSAVSMPNLVTGMNNLGVMSNEAMDGTLSERLRGMAGADAMQAGSMGLQAAGRQMERFGSTMNPNALGAQTANAGLGMARMRSNAMNQANNAAEDVKWQRNAALTGLASGQGAQAVSGMGSLAGQIGQNRQMDNQANAQSSQGDGMMGAWLGDKMFADGGEVGVDGAPKFASGGGLQMYKPQGMPTVNPMQFGNSTDSDGRSNGSALSAIAQPLALSAASKLAGKALKEAGLTKALGNAWDGAVSSAGDSIKGLMGVPGAGSNSLINATSAGMDGVSQVGAPIADTAVAATTLAEQGAEQVATEAASMVPGLGQGIGMASNLAQGDYVGAALNAIPGGNYIDMAKDFLFDFADGGPVPKQGLKRKDYSKKGGKVSGPGTETSDSIPAWLSDGEFVVNAEAMKDPKAAKTVKKINQKGLQKRTAKQSKGAK
jgi:hypothetical protein